MAQKTANLRKFAQWKDCQVRIYGVCNHNNETTIWAHYRLGGVAGMGQKPPDLCGSLCCSACHDVIDGRRKTDLDKIQIESHMLHGMVRSLKIIDENYVLVTRE